MQLWRKLIGCSSHEVNQIEFADLISIRWELCAANGQSNSCKLYSFRLRRCDVITCSSHLLLFEICLPFLIGSLSSASSFPRQLPSKLSINLRMAIVLRSRLVRLVQSQGLLSKAVAYQLPCLQQAANISSKAYRDLNGIKRPPPYDYKNKPYNYFRSLIDRTTHRFDDNSKVGNRCIIWPT